MTSSRRSGPRKGQTGQGCSPAAESPAFERARLLQLERRRTEQLRGLAEAALAINASLSLDEALQTITERARLIIGAHQAVTSFTIGQDWAQSINAVSLSDKYAAYRGYDAQPNGTGIYRLVCLENRPYRLTQAELEAHPAWRGFGAEAERHPPLRGWLAAPLIGRGGRNLGLIQLSDRYEGDFTAEDEAILVQIAQMAAVAVENARLYEQSQLAVRSRDTLLAIVAHDLRSPLTSVKGYAQLLQRYAALAGPSEVTERLVDATARIVAATRKMATLIDDLVDMAQVEMGGTLQLQRGETDLVALAQRVLAEHQQMAAEHRLRLEAATPALIGQWDAARLERVLDNLVSNAVKYSPEGSEVTLRLDQEGDWVVVQVQDQGIGIPAADLTRLGEPFYRGRNTSGRAGTGLGLWGVRQIVEQHGGAVHIASREGEGTTVTVRLPLRWLETGVQSVLPGESR